MNNSSRWLMCCLILGLAANASAGVLTSQAISRGFSLTTFVSGFNERFDVGNVSAGGLGPLGIAFTESGVLISDGDGYIRSLPSRADGQTIPAVTASTPNYGFVGAMGMARLDGRFYVGGYHNKVGVYEVTNTGSFVRDLTNNPTRSVVADEANHILYAAGTGIFRIDPFAQTSQLLPFLITEVDGIALSDGVLYATGDFSGSDWDSIVGYRLSDGVKVFDSGRIDGVDGTAIGKGSLAGKLYANTNFGELWEFDLATSERQLIMFGGTRGDFVSVDPFDGSLLVTQSNEILRLTPPAGGSFATVPEPSMLLIGLVSLSAFGGAGLRRKGCRP